MSYNTPLDVTWCVDVTRHVRRSLQRRRSVGRPLSTRRSSHALDDSTFLREVEEAALGRHPDRTAARVIAARAAPSV